MPDPRDPRPIPEVDAMPQFFAYDPEGQFDIFKTEAEAKAEAQKYLDYYSDSACEGWDEAVDQIAYGVILGGIVKTVEREPTEEERAQLNGCDLYVDYELQAEDRQPIEDYFARAATRSEIEAAKSASQAQPSEVVVSSRWELETWHAETEEWMTSYFDTEAVARTAMDQRTHGTVKRLIEVTVSESRRIVNTELVPHADALSGKAVRE